MGFRINYGGGMFSGALASGIFNNAEAQISFSRNVQKVKLEQSARAMDLQEAQMIAQQQMAEDKMDMAREQMEFARQDAENREAVRVAENKAKEIAGLKHNNAIKKENLRNEQNSFNQAGGRVYDGKTPLAENQYLQTGRDGKSYIFDRQMKGLSVSESLADNKYLNEMLQKTGGTQISLEQVKEIESGANKSFAGKVMKVGNNFIAVPQSNYDTFVAGGKIGSGISGVADLDFNDNQKEVLKNAKSNIDRINRNILNIKAGKGSQFSMGIKDEDKPAMIEKLEEEKQRYSWEYQAVQNSNSPRNKQFGIHKSSADRYKSEKALIDKIKKVYGKADYRKDKNIMKAIDKFVGKGFDVENGNYNNFIMSQKGSYNGIMKFLNDKQNQGKEVKRISINKKDIDYDKRQSVLDKRDFGEMKNNWQEYANVDITGEDINTENYPSGFGNVIDDRTDVDKSKLKDEWYKKAGKL